MASFLYYYRLWNGDMTISHSANSESAVSAGGIPLEESKAICLALTSQLLNKDS
tara:strand:- start:570 stop:731 length:162 start_codon:yes stop_codon:yes gene_type:complete